MPKVLKSFPQVKEAIYKHIILFYLLPLIYSGEVIGLKIMHSQNLSNIIFLPLVYILLALIAVFLYRNRDRLSGKDGLFAPTFSANNPSLVPS